MTFSSFVYDFTLGVCVAVGLKFVWRVLTHEGKRKQVNLSDCMIIDKKSGGKIVISEDDFNNIDDADKNAKYFAVNSMYDYIMSHTHLDYDVYHKVSVLDVDIDLTK